MRPRLPHKTTSHCPKMLSRTERLALPGSPIFETFRSSLPGPALGRLPGHHSRLLILSIANFKTGRSFVQISQIRLALT